VDCSHKVRVRDPLFEKLVAEGKFDYAYNIRGWEDVDGHILDVPHIHCQVPSDHILTSSESLIGSHNTCSYFILTVICCIPMVSPRFITRRFFKWYPQDPFSAMWIPWSLHRKRRHFSCQRNYSVRQNVFAVYPKGTKNDKVPKSVWL
jgi:hypothetical protein